MLLGLRHRLRTLRLNTSKLESNTDIEAGKCCLCGQFKRPRIVIKTQGSWGMWADRYLCSDCTALAAYVDRAIALAQSNATTQQKPIKHELPTVEQKHREIDLAILEAIYSEEKPLTTSQIFKWLDKRRRYYNRSYISAACMRLRDRNILQVEIGPHKAYVWAIAAQDREVAA